MRVASFAVSTAHTVARLRFPRALQPLRSASIVKASRPRTSSVMTASQNPLLSSDHFPNYDSVKAEDVVPGVRSLLAELDAELDALEKASINLEFFSPLAS